MPSITREQAIRLNNQAPKDWSFDVRYYVLNGEKTIRRVINLDDKHAVEGRLYYSENIERKHNDYCSWNVPAGHYHICLHVSTWTIEGNVGHSFGLGKFVNLDHAQHAKRNYKELCKMAETITDEMILGYTGLCENSPI